MPAARNAGRKSWTAFLAQNDEHQTERDDEGEDEEFEAGKAGGAVGFGDETRHVDLTEHHLIAQHDEEHESTASAEPLSHDELRTRSEASSFRVGSSFLSPAAMQVVPGTPLRLTICI